MGEIILYVSLISALYCLLIQYIMNGDRLRFGYGRMLGCQVPGCLQIGINVKKKYCAETHLVAFYSSYIQFTLNDIQDYTKRFYKKQNKKISCKPLLLL